MTLLTWLGILLCLTQSALFSGMNLGLFSVSRLELMVLSRKGNRQAHRVLALREDSNFALVTILWGNVGVNVLLALLSSSVMTGLVAFLFSTVIITLFAEILPQSWFTRHALPLAARLTPWLKFYQCVLYPVARPTAWVLDHWLGEEAIRYIRERDLREMIRLHMEADESDIARVEGQGALNFLEIDDVPLSAEGEPVDPASIIALDFDGERPLFPTLTATPDDPFLQRVNASGKSWVILVDRDNRPRRVLRSRGFLRQALFTPERFDPQRHCHTPIVVDSGRVTLGELMLAFRVSSWKEEDDIVDKNVILLWNDAPRIITGTDILGRLLRGISRRAGGPDVERSLLSNRNPA